MRSSKLRLCLILGMISIGISIAAFIEPPKKSEEPGPFVVPAEYEHTMRRYEVYFEDPDGRKYSIAKRWLFGDQRPGSLGFLFHFDWPLTDQTSVNWPNKRNIFGIVKAGSRVAEKKESRIIQTGPPQLLKYELDCSLPQTCRLRSDITDSHTTTIYFDQKYAPHAADILITAASIYEKRKYLQ